MISNSLSSPRILICGLELPSNSCSQIQCERMAGLVAGDPEKQYEWHETYRDFMKNMYRTSYDDMAKNREVHVKSDLPSGFGGHVPSVRHDILFRNTAFDRAQEALRTDPNRDARPSFQDHIAGIPSTPLPRGARKPPSYGVVPHDGTTTMLKPPWGVITTRNFPLSHRCPPPTMVEGQSRLTDRFNQTAPGGFGSATPTPRN